MASSTLSTVARSIASVSAPLNNALVTRDDSSAPGAAQKSQGIGLTSFLTAVATSLVIFAVQITLFLILRNKLARIFKPKTYLVPERERTEQPPRSFFGMIKDVLNYSDREVIKKCGLDAYFFLRYLKTLLVIFIPIVLVVMPILIPINYIGGRGQSIESPDNGGSNTNTTQVIGLDVLAWGNVSDTNTSRYAAHLVMAILVIIWVCGVFFVELRVYIKVRQDYLTSAEHRLRASATTVLVGSIPEKWLSEEALRGLFDIFPGGIRNVWINRDLSTLLDKVSRRNAIHKQLESAETTLVKDAKKAQLKQREKEEKKRRKEMKLKSITKQERAARQAEDDAEAKRMAESAEGAHAGEVEDTPHTVAAGVRESRLEEQEQERGHERQWSKGFKIPGIADPLSKVGLGLMGAVSKAGNEMDETLETTNGFVGLETRPAGQSAAIHGHDSRVAQMARMSEDVPPPSATETLDQARSRLSADSTRAIKKPEPEPEAQVLGNTVRKLGNIDDLYVKEQPKVWQFWKPPVGGYASPVPQGIEAEDYITAKANENKSAWRKFKESLPFTGKDPEPADYPAASNPDYNEDKEGGAEWEKYLKKKDRPTHHLPAFGVNFLPGIIWVTKKVDTIYWCRAELARLNVEIEEDQKHPDRFPLMNSAFVQFNHQVASHMACQSLMHHIPKQMAPRINEVSPKDVIWDNMALSWWQEWLRTCIVAAVVAVMIFLWAIPVAWTAALGQLDVLIRDNKWLSFLEKNQVVEDIAKAVAGVLPAALLGLLLFLVPIILSFLAAFKGAKTGSQKTEFVQVFYFVFLFIQVFLVVSIASFFAASFNDLLHNLETLKSVGAVLNLLATNLPKAANYFFSYMVLQALSTSSGTLLQIGGLFTWFILAKILDSSARAKWKRNTSLNSVSWGSFFPIYTNFACIGLIYCVISPLIAIFAVITFSLLYLAHRYSMLYVTRFEYDTGGVLYPRAINQTFTGLYMMELCLAGLFFIVQDEHGHNKCTTHGIIMIVVLILTVIYQFVLNFSFSPLFRYLPITIEDEAVLRDEAFQRAQDRRMGIEDAYDQYAEDDPDSPAEKSPRLNGQGIELQRLQAGRQGLNRLRNPVKQVGSWAKGGGKQVSTWAKGGEDQLRKITNMRDSNQASEYRRRQREKDMEAQRAIGDALFGGIHDEIEDLTPEERDALVRHAFMHEALRARRPTVWIPHDDIGVSEDEIRRTKEYSEHIWISNEGTALDSKLRVVYGKNPPDFSEVDLINL